MIHSDQMIPLLLEACPSYAGHFEELRGSCAEGLLYIELGNFARHLLRLHQQGRTEEFPAVARMIERLHTEGSPDVQEAATIGLLEGIQNSWGNEGVDPELFAFHLLPVSAKWWRSLNDFWDGNVRTVGENLDA